MDRTSPRIAVVIPCFDDAATLPETIASLDGAEPVEIVVSDDGSTDPATLEYLAALEAEGRPHLQVLRTDENTGPGGARMRGVRATTAEYIYPLDADDLAVAPSLTIMADLLDADPGAAACAGDYVEFGAQRNHRTVPAGLDPFRVAYVNEYPITALFRRSVLLETGGWRPVAGYEDWDLWMTLAERGERVLHAGPGVVTYRRRMHDGRRLSRSKRRHRALYRAMRDRHPALFARLPEARRTTTLSPVRRVLYPILYGDRNRYGFEITLRRAFDRVGLFPLGR
jgi:glycosyltransferase involved in cell wall biosynthesis